LPRTSGRSRSIEHCRGMLYWIGGRRKPRGPSPLGKGIDHDQIDHDQDTSRRDRRGRDGG
jgi:hypothetical protein